MTKTAEKNLWKWLATAKDTLANLDMNRVENLLMRGMPDVEGCLDGRQFWIELKTAARPKRKDTRVRFKFQPGQCEWLMRRAKAGGRTWLLLQVGSGKSASRYLVRGSAGFLVRDGVTEEDLFWECKNYSSNPATIVKASAGQ